jgi:hypothetical protein
VSSIDDSIQHLDPSAFFQDEEDDLDEEEEAAEVAAATKAVEAMERRQADVEKRQSEKAGKFSRNSSSSSLKDLFSGASWTAMVNSANNFNLNSTNPLNTVNKGQQGNSPAALQRSSMPILGAGAATSPAESPIALTDMCKESSSHKAATGNLLRHGSAQDLGRQQLTLSQHQQTPPSTSSNFLNQQEHLLRTQKQMHAELASQQVLQQQQHCQRQLYPSPADAATAGPGSAVAAAAAAASHRSSQQQHLRAVLASIVPGPLPQPPAARVKSASVPAASSMPRPLLPEQHQLPQMLQLSAAQPVAALHPVVPQQQQQQHGSLLKVPSMQAGTATASSEMIPSATSCCLPAAAVWDPFLELLNERTATINAESGSVAAITTS